MKVRKFEVIKCPKCDYEYLPAEIFVPKNFFGIPFDIERDFSGRILEYSGSSVDLIESYTCDNCNHIFKVNAKIQFNTELDRLENFDEEYSSQLYTEKNT